MSVANHPCCRLRILLVDKFSEMQQIERLTSFGVSQNKHDYDIQSSRYLALFSTNRDKRDDSV